MLYRLCFEGKNLADSEKEVLKESMKFSTVRSQVSDFFLAFMSPRNIRNEQCLETLGDTIKSMFNDIQNAPQSE